MSRLLKTVCSRDCPDVCAIQVRVEEGRAVALKGDREDPVTQGFLCERTQRFLHRQYSDDRFMTPMVRVRGKLVPIDWPQALDLAAEKLTVAKGVYGAASVLHYKSGGSLGILKNAASVLFDAWGPVTVKRGDICSGAGEAAQVEDFGVAESHDLFDLYNAKLILLWGKNPHTSGVHLLPILKKAHAQGAKIIAIDPVKTRAAQLADAFLQPRPGADSAVALGVARCLFEAGAIDPQARQYCDHLDAFERLARARTLEDYAQEADLPAAVIASLARDYAERSPAAILVGWGMGRRKNGSATVRTLDALGAISGNLGVAGGGVSYNFRRRMAFDCDFGVTPAEPPRTFAEALLGQEILAAKNPPVRVIWVTAGNPISMLPDANVVREAFRKVDFKVVVDTHPTDTTDIADLVLPTLTLLEDDDLLGSYGNHYLRASTPVLSPPAQTKHELHIWQGLAQRLGVGEVMDGSIQDWKRRATRRLQAAGVAVEALEAGPQKNPFVKPVLFGNRRFETSTGRVNLIRTTPERPQPDAEYPLLLLAVSTPKAQSSQQAYPVSGAPVVRVHPSVAAEIGDGQQACLQSRQGRLTVLVQADPKVRADVALMDKGGMFRDGRCVNALVRASETDDGGGAAYYDEPVRLTPSTN